MPDMRSQIDGWISRLSGRGRREPHSLSEDHFSESEPKSSRSAERVRRLRLGLRAFLRYPLNARKRRQYRRKHGNTRNASPPPLSVTLQIQRQARHEPAIFAPGRSALPYLRQVHAANLAERDGVDVIGLFAKVRARPKTVLVAPWLNIGGADNYGADLLDALLAAGAGPALAVITQQTAAEAEGWEKREEIARLAPFRAASVLFWPDFCAPSAVIFGRFLNALGAERIIVINSRVGLEAVAMFGRGLSRNARLYCAYFSLDVNVSVAVYGARFPRRTTPFALTLTDNEPMALTMRRLHGGQPGPGIAVLPPRLPAVADEVFFARVAARRKRARGGAQPRWVWVSRIERMKGVEVLKCLAELRPNDQFDLYGPTQDDPRELGLVMPNLRYRGVLPDVGGADFSDYDGFAFTSLFEGMPNITLEMCQQAVPMILADVGGLRDTFVDGVLFVPHQAKALETASLFADALDQVASMDGAAIAAMVTAARKRALLRHAPAAYFQAVKTIFGLS